MFLPALFSYRRDSFLDPVMHSSDAFAYAYLHALSAWERGVEGACNGRYVELFADALTSPPIFTRDPEMLTNSAQHRKCASLKQRPTTTHVFF